MDSKVALVHYWLTGMRGGEKVLETLSELYPSADIYTHVFNPDEISTALKEKSINTSFIDSLPFAKKLYKYYLPLMPLALEGLDLTDYDLVISSESGPAKGVITDPEALHVTYCHSPMRYLWDLKEDYFGDSSVIKKMLMSPLLHYLRMWDQLSAERVDRFVANSNFVSQRIKKFYRRDSKVIPPPVDVEQYTPGEAGDYFLYVGELVPYKRPDLAVEAFNQLELPLKVVGKGEMKPQLEKRAEDNVEFLGFVDDEQLPDIYSAAQALVYPGKEDFGIIPVEAMASGAPVIAYKAGGALDTVTEGENGLFFEPQNVSSLVEAVEGFNREDFDRADIISSAEFYRKERFKEEFKEFIKEEMNKTHER